MNRKKKNMKFKRYCKTLKLKEDEKLISEYKKLHAKGATWPEITQGMKEVGILDMEIYIQGNQLFMIMETVADFDHEVAMQELGQKPRQSEWETYVSKFQQTTEDASASAKWRLMDRIYKMDQKEEYSAAEGQIEYNYDVK